MPWNMQDAIPLTLWIIDLESASKDLGQGIGTGKDEGCGCCPYWNEGALRMGSRKDRLTVVCNLVGLF